MIVLTRLKHTYISFEKQLDCDYGSVGDRAREVEYGVVHTNQSVPVNARVHVNNMGNAIPFMCWNINRIDDKFGDPDAIVLLERMKDE